MKSTPNIFAVKASIMEYGIWYAIWFYGWREAWTLWVATRMIARSEDQSFKAVARRIHF